jgi:SAM-dependent methyltransferase
VSERVAVTNFSASWVRVDQTSDPSFYASLLDATRADGLAEARRDPDTAFAALKLRPGLRVLDVGCGTGDYLRIMAGLVAPGPAVGVDLSATLAARAQQRAAPAQAAVSFHVGDARELNWQLERRGFTHVTATPQLRLSREPGAVHQWLIEPVTHELVRTGALTPEQGRLLLADLNERAEDGRYFLARTYYTIIATAA